MTSAMSGINFAIIIQSSSNFGTSDFAFTISRDGAARKLIKGLIGNFVIPIEL